MSKKAKGEVEGFPMDLPKREIYPALFEVFIEKVEFNNIRIENT